MMKHISTVLLSLLLVLPGFPSDLPAQTGRSPLARQELTSELHRLELLAADANAGGEERARAEAEAAVIRARLVTGDIQVGDQIELQVEGEDTLSGTFTVRPGQVLTLPTVGDIPLAGVLRSELAGHITDALSKYIRDPVVRAESLMRVTISGQVGQPGFYGVRAERLLSDAIMAAGGPATNANLEKMYIVRGGERIWEGEHLQQAIAEGRTLDQLSLTAGDQIVIPADAQGAGTRMVGIVTGVISAAALLVTIFRQ